LTQLAVDWRHKLTQLANSYLLVGNRVGDRNRSSWHTRIDRLAAELAAETDPVGLSWYTEIDLLAPPVGARYSSSWYTEIDLLGIEFVAETNPEQCPEEIFSNSAVGNRVGEKNRVGDRETFKQPSSTKKWISSSRNSVITISRNQVLLEERWELMYCRGGTLANHIDLLFCGCVSRKQTEYHKSMLQNHLLRIPHEQ